MNAVRLVFDRGTLVLEGVPREQDLSQIPGVLWSARAGVYRAPAGCFYALASELRRRGVPLTDSPLPRLGPPVARAPLPQPRPDPAVPLAAWRLAGRRGVLALPAESARVQLALAAIRDGRTPTLVLSRSRGLTGRWTRILAERFEGVSCLDEDGSTATSVTVATAAHAYQCMWRLGDHFGLLVVDDAQDYGRGFPDEVLQLCTAPLRLGLAARAPAMGPVREHLATLVGPVIFEVCPAERPGEYRPAYEHHAWRAAAGTDRSRRRRALAALIRQHGVENTLVFLGEDPAAGAVLNPGPLGAGGRREDPGERKLVMDACSAGRVRPLRSAPRLASEAGPRPPAEVAVIVADERAVATDQIRCVARLLTPPPGDRALIYEI